MIRKIAWFVLGLEIASIAIIGIEGGFATPDGPTFWFAPIANAILFVWLLFMIWSTTNVALDVSNLAVSSIVLICYLIASVFSLFVPTNPASNYSVEFNLAVIFLVFGGNGLALFEVVRLLTKPNK